MGQRVDGHPRASDRRGQALRVRGQGRDSRSSSDPRAQVHGRGQDDQPRSLSAYSTASSSERAVRGLGAAAMRDAYFSLYGVHLSTGARAPPPLRRPTARRRARHRLDRLRPRRAGPAHRPCWCDRRSRARARDIRVLGALLPRSCRPRAHSPRGSRAGRPPTTPSRLVAPSRGFSRRAPVPERRLRARARASRDSPAPAARRSRRRACATSREPSPTCAVRGRGRPQPKEGADPRRARFDRDDASVVTGVGVLARVP